MHLIQLGEEFLQAVLVGHVLESANITINIRVDGLGDRICGHTVHSMPVHPPPKIIVILGEDDRRERPEAAGEFGRAAEELVRSNVEFYTVLRPNQNAPALLWTRDYRRP